MVDSFDPGNDFGQSGIMPVNVIGQFGLCISSFRSVVLFEHDLFGKLAPTVPDHALV
jgi:hypothetical protein